MNKVKEVEYYYYPTAKIEIIENGIGVKIFGKYPEL